MNKTEAKTILKKELARLRKQPYSYFKTWFDYKHIESYSIKSETGSNYQIEIAAILDKPTNLNLRVLGSIDDGTLLSSFAPVCDDFIISPDGPLKDQED